MVSRREWAEPASWVKPCRDGLGVDDGARKQHGNRTSHGEGSDGEHGMREHRLGVGDVGQMQGGVWGICHAKDDNVHGAKDIEL